MVAASLDAPLEDVQILWYYRNAEKIVYEFNSSVFYHRHYIFLLLWV